MSWSSNKAPGAGLAAAIVASACTHAIALALLQPASGQPAAEHVSTSDRRPLDVTLEAPGPSPSRAGSGKTAAPERLTQALPAARYYTTRELDGTPGPLAQIEPQYPESAARRHLGGRVVVRLFIDEAGSVERVVTLRADPPGHFEEAVGKAFRAARFTPGIKNGRPVKAQLTLAVSFDAPPLPLLPAGG